MPHANQEVRKAYMKVYREKNKELLKEKKKVYDKLYNAIYYAKNAEILKVRAAKWKSENKNHVDTVNQIYRDNNKETTAASRKKWSMNNQEKIIANIVMRRTAKMRRTPSWLTVEQRKQIEDIYREAKMREVETGIKHHVDHVIPLQGKTVSGLHVPENLRVITATENHRKFNKFCVDSQL